MNTSLENRPYPSARPAPAACALIAARNEARFIQQVVRSARRYLPVWVVDDGSSDGTGTLAARAGAEVIRHPAPLGKGAGLRDGFSRLIDSFEAIVTLDGDRQHDPAEIPRLLAAAREADLVIGARRREAPMPRSRRFSNGSSTLILSALLRRRFSDVHCGFRVYRTSALRRLEIRSSGFTIEVELLLKAVRAGWRIVERPIRTLYGSERSKIAPVSDALRFLRTAAVVGLGWDV